MLSNKAKYGLKALLYLAEQEENATVLIAEIAEQRQIPRKFLEAILLELRSQGILHSRKGRGGGYSLGRPAGQISIGKVIRVLDGPLAPIACVSRTAYRPCDDCTDERNCAIRSLMQEVRDAIAGILDNTSLADLKERAGKAGMVLDYMI